MKDIFLSASKPDDFFNRYIFKTSLYIFFRFVIFFPDFIKISILTLDISTRKLLGTFGGRGGVSSARKKK